MDEPNEKRLSIWDEPIWATTKRAVEHDKTFLKFIENCLLPEIERVLKLGEFKEQVLQIETMAREYVSLATFLRDATKHEREVVKDTINRERVRHLWDRIFYKVQQLNIEYVTAYWLAHKASPESEELLPFTNYSLDYDWLTDDYDKKYKSGDTPKNGLI